MIRSNKIKMKMKIKKRSGVSVIANFMLVLHNHMPYVKHHGRKPLGETWLFEAMAETYIPFIQTWSRLTAENISAPVVLSFSPTLLEQLSSKYIQKEFINYLKEREEAALRDEKYYLATSEKDMAILAACYYRFYRDIRRDFVCEYDCNLLAALKNLAQLNDIEFITTAASHAYLPLLPQKSLEKQIRLGKRSYEKHFDCEPKGFWLPECGYFAGIENILLDNGFSYFFVDSHAIEGGKPLAISSQTTFNAPDNPGNKDTELEFYKTGLTTHQPYCLPGKNIMVIGRNGNASQLVWSANLGYAGDYRYREFHKQSTQSLLKYWSVTDKNNQPFSKLSYSFERAQEKAQQDATHFVKTLCHKGQEASLLGHEHPMIVGCFDAELFGHWWWEGIIWLEEVIRGIAVSDELFLILPSAINPPQHEAKLYESSWGQGGKHAVWLNQHTQWMWDIIKEANLQIESLRIHNNDKNIFDPPENDTAITQKVYQQALRELILLESSDWLFMVSNNQTRDYAITRFFEHYANFVTLITCIKETSYHERFIAWFTQIEQENDFLISLMGDSP